MVNAKAEVDNKEKRKKRQKRDAMSVEASTMNSFSMGETEITSEDIAIHAEALAAAKRAVAPLKRVIDESTSVLKAAILRQWCDHYTKKGREPGLRKIKAKSGEFLVVQNTKVDMVQKNYSTLIQMGLDADSYSSKSYSIKMGNASKTARKKIIESLKEILGEDYDDVVTTKFTLEGDFFSNLGSVVRSSLRENESYDEKLMEAMRVIGPTITMKDFKSDIPEVDGYELAYELAHNSSKKKGA